MLRWETHRNTWTGFSGEREVASFYKQGAGEYLWTTMKPFGDGCYFKAESLQAAKSAAEQAFKAWCEQANVTVIPEGWQLVPKEPTFAMIAAAKLALIKDPLKRSSTVYRAMLAESHAQTARCRSENHG